MKGLGLKHFRISFSWPRILPDGYPSSNSSDGVKFYMDLLTELKNNGIEPWVTLYHWDLPATLNDKTPQGGWLSPTIVERFRDYADFCF